MSNSALGHRCSRNSKLASSHQQYPATAKRHLPQPLSQSLKMPFSVHLVHPPLGTDPPIDHSALPSQPSQVYPRRKVPYITLATLLYGVIFSMKIADCMADFSLFPRYNFQPAFAKTPKETLRDVREEPTPAQPQLELQFRYQSSRPIL